MWKKIKRPLMWILTIQAAAWMAGQIITKKLTRGDEDSDDFGIAAICGGKKFVSHAEHLRRGSAVAGMGGVEIDLRDATLDPAGATLELNALMGGIQLTVPEEWAVDFENENFAGGFEAKVTPLEDLPEDAPKLHVHAVTRMGGAVVSTKELASAEAGCC